MLSTLYPNESENYSNQEPTEQSVGVTRNPNISVTAKKGNHAVLQSSYAFVDVTVNVWIEVDDDTQRQGLDAIYGAIAAILDNPTLHQVINGYPANSSQFLCEGSLNRDGSRNANEARYERTYSLQLICIAKY